MVRRQLATGLLALGAVLTGGLTCGVAEAGSAPGGGTPLGAVQSKPSGIADPVLGRAVRDVLAGRPVDPQTATVHGGMVRVEVAATPGQDARTAVAAVGGRVQGAVDDGFVLADVPAGRTAQLQARSDVAFVRLPQAADVPVDGQQASPTALPASTQLSASSRGQYGGEVVTKTGVAAWQQAGYLGAGVKIGIIDQFNGTAWNADLAAGELNGNPAGAICLHDGDSCASTFWNAATPHGTAVAEVLSDQAPGAIFYLATIHSATDAQAAVDYFAANGVRIISHSETGQYDGPGNGTGPLDQVIANAEAKGIAWFQAAGNSAGVPGVRYGSYFRSGWVDTDGDGFMNFPDGSEYLAFGCGYLNGLRWNDWSGNGTDYDVYLYAARGGAPIDSSTVAQQQGYWPVENLWANGLNGLHCASQSIYYVAIKLYAAGNGTAGDVLEFMDNGTGVSFATNPFSAGGPYSDAANPGEASIGAVDPIDGTTIADYSSQGPTNDNRIKPDLSAGSGMTSLAYNGRFTGTSAATPAAAGAAAVLLGANPAWTPAQLMSAMRGQVADRGAPGTDNVYGTGELLLGPPPAPPVTAPPVGAPGSVRGLRLRSARRLVSWKPPATDGGSPVTTYVVAVYHGKKRVWLKSVSAAHHRIHLRGKALHHGRNRLYVTAYNGTAYAPWKLLRYRVG